MHSMLNEFYEFIANRINQYFQEQSATGLLLPGESFCLKLDDDNMVQKVSHALETLLDKNGNKGKYSYCCMDGSTYSTFTIRVKDNEVIVAAQDPNMTSDFLGASLRNAANEQRKPLLMVTARPIDSALSGSRDMSAKGMPFYADNLVSEIREMISTSTTLSMVEKNILKYELDRREEDVFSDKSSLYEYKELLAIMSSGSIDESVFPGFRLFYINGKTDFDTYGENQVKREIRRDHELFERIDRSVRFGNVETDLSADFDDRFINNIISRKNKNIEQWSRLLTYAQVLAAMERKQAKKDKPLSIEKENIYAYRDMELNQYIDDAELFIRNEGSQKAKKRTKNILIFNADCYPVVHLKVDCNIRIPNTGVNSDIASFERDKNALIFSFEDEQTGFHRITIADEANKITYVLKVCILNISARYLMPTIKTSFVIDFNNNKKKCRMKLLGIGTDLSFNQTGETVVSEKLEDNKQYDCDYRTRLTLTSTEDELSNYGNGISLDINFAGVLVPFVLFPDEAKSQEITGRRILRDKLSYCNSFTLYGGGQIQRDSQEYFVKGHLAKELNIENTMINCQVLTGNLSDDKNPKIQAEDLRLSPALKTSYLNYLDVFRKKETTPTLAYIGDEEIKSAAEQYLADFINEFAQVKERMTLSLEQQNALLLGMLIAGNNAEEILLTPFHPLNVAYQLFLFNENDIEHASDVVVDRLNSIYLLPYIQRKRKVYKVSDQTYSLEWKYYAPVKNRKYMGGRRYVAKLVEDKVEEFTSHFRYIFDEINNRVIKINLINMGDCSEILQGIAQYYCHAVKRTPDVEKLLKFEIRVYSNETLDNSLNFLKNRIELKRFLDNHRLSIDSGTAMNDLEGIIAKNVHCFFNEDNGNNYEYAHITFYEMESEVTSETATMDQIATGVSLGGLLSGVPSSRYGQKYRTGFGSKYAKKSELEKMAELINSLSQVGDSGNPYQPGVSISTQINDDAEDKMNYIYQSSNWVVFVDPKVDLDFFCEKEAKNDLLIIHYSDQYTSSSGYDAITVTHKSKQYANVIQEYLANKGVMAQPSDVGKIINLFNAINGDWLLRLVSSKRMVGVNKDSTFSREKISIIAAIKLMLAYLKHTDILWVPISMEEMLRVSGGAGLSQNDGILSAKNLGFEKGPTSDDLLFVGIHQNKGQLKVYFYPTEVKTGNNSSSVIAKAFEQAAHTADGLQNAFNPDEDKDSIMYKINRNFMMQLVINSCKKMQVYHVDDSQDWNIVLDTYREHLLNEEFTVSTNIRDLLGKGAVLSFKKGLLERTTSFKEDSINFLELPETDEYNLILKDVSVISDLLNNPGSGIMPLGEMKVDDLNGSGEGIKSTPYNEKDDPVDPATIDQPEPVTTEPEQPKLPDQPEEPVTPVPQADKPADDAESGNGIRVRFGKNRIDGSPVYWYPNDTQQVFHTNTGIIGTMGTGKTQFTKSLITQLYCNAQNNVDGGPLGILIFDYKGDYNDSKPDFVEAVKPIIVSPYHLPFNPFSLIQGNGITSLLPIHTANTFKETLSAVFNLGPKQDGILMQCLKAAYESKGIKPADSTTWSNNPPTFEDVYSIYMNDDGIKKNDTLFSAMSKLHDFEIFEPDVSKTKSLYDLLNGIVVVNLSLFAGQDDIQDLVVAITLNLFYAQMQAIGSSKLDGKLRQLTKFILVDEADNFMRKDFPALRKILKEGREFGVGTILSTQFLKHFETGEDNYAKYILTWVVHCVADFNPSDVDFVFNTEPKSKEEQQLFNNIKQLKMHTSIARIGTSKPIYLEDLPFWKLMKGEE